MNQTLKFAVALKIGLGAGALGLLLSGATANAQTPQKGGILNFATLGAVPTLDCGAINITPLIITVAPAYSTLLRFDPDTYPAIVGDLADSWTMSPDRLTYTVKLRPEVKFHDGSTLTSDDVKASYDRMRDPPTGVTSLYQGLYASIAEISTPDPLTVQFKMSKPNPGMLLALAHPFGCIYSAKKIRENPKYPETNVMGTGPFKLAEFIPGASISYVRNDNYFVKGLPHLDGLKAFALSAATLQTAVQGGQVEAVFTQISPLGKSNLEAAMGDKVVFQTGPYNVHNFIDVNTSKAPLDDPRVRLAMQYAIDRRGGDQIMRKATTSGGFGVVFGADVALDFKPSELDSLPGYSPDLAANRAKAKELLAQAGVKDLKLTILGKNTGEPYTSLGVIVTDSLRQIGITVEARMFETGPYVANLSGKNYDLAIDANGTTSSDPTEVLEKYLPNSNLNFTGYKDQVLQDLYDKQAIESDQAKRRELVLAFERRLVETASILPMYRTINIAALTPRVKGWKILPSPTLGVDMRSVWLQK